MEVAPESVLIRVEGNVGRITLNKPQSTNALDLPMIRSIAGALRLWRSDSTVALVLIDHGGGRGFCAGGDALGLAKSAQADGAWARTYFAEQYALNGAIFSFPRPVVAIADGVVVGGGLGLALPARHTVVTERTMMAFLETTIGMAPDVGASWFLPRLPGATGMWLALTGARIKGAECVSSGLADACVEQGSVDELKSALLQRPDTATSTLKSFNCADIQERGDQAEIDRLFGRATLRQVRDALEAEATPFAVQHLQAIDKASPLASAAAFTLLDRAAMATNFVDALELEYRVSSRLLSQHDFMAWSEAVLIDNQPAPPWRPANLGEVSERAVAALFAPLAGWPAVHAAG